MSYKKRDKKRREEKKRKEKKRKRKKGRKIDRQIPDMKDSRYILYYPPMIPYKKKKENRYYNTIMYESVHVYNPNFLDISFYMTRTYF